MRLLTFVTLFLITTITLAQEGWLNQDVVPKRGAPEISHTDAKGNVIALGKIDYFPVTVRDEKGDWVKVQVRDIAGWVPKESLVRVAEGIPYFTDRIQKKDNLAEAYQMRAELYAIKNEIDLAIKDADEAIKISPNAEAYVSRGNHYIRKMDNDKAIADFSEAIKANPKQVFAFYNRGRALHNKKDYDKAIADFSETLRLDPKFVNALFARGQAQADKKDFEKAIADYTETLKLDPKHADAANGLAWLFATCSVDKYRDGKQAVGLARLACELNQWKEPSHLDTLAAAYAETGDFDQAVKYQKQALTFPDFEKEFGDTARKQLKLYEEKKPVRE